MTFLLYYFVGLVVMSVAAAQFLRNSDFGHDVNWSDGEDIAFLALLVFLVVAIGALAWPVALLIGGVMYYAAPKRKNT